MAAPTPSPFPQQPPKPPQKKSSKVITLSIIGVISVMVVGFCAAQDNDDDVTADCVDQNSLQADGSYAVVDDDYCDSTHYRGPHGAFLWYYAGSRVGARVMRGTTIRPPNVNISSRTGHDIQRGGFGSRSSSGG